MAVAPIVSANIPRLVAYTATAGQTAFPIAFAYLDESDIHVEVWRAGARVAAYEGGDGSLSCSPATDGVLVAGVAGTATIPACTLNDTVLVFALTTPERDVIYANPADVTRDNLNREFNRRVAVEAELRRDIDGAVRISRTAAGVEITPGADGTLLGWAGGVLANIAGAISTALVSTFMSAPILASSAHAFAKAVGLDMSVSSRSALKGLTSPSASIAYNALYGVAAGDGWGGKFEWLSTNQSANVTADPAEAIYVAPSSDPTGASGAWRRVRDGDYAKAAWFAIRGDAGVTSNTPTMFQRMEDTCNTLNIRQIRYEERNYYWSDTIVMRRSFMRHLGLGASQTALTFNHTNNGIQYGDDTLFCYRPTVRGFSYSQPSGSAFCHHFYHGRELTLGDYINGSDVRNFIKIGSTRVLITNIANNGAGLIRITVGSAQAWQTGMKVAVTQVDGDASLVAALANIQFNITRISSTVFDLQGTTFAGAYTTGGVIAPFTAIIEFDNGSSGDAMKIRGTHFVANYSLAGNMIFTGSHAIESPSYAAGSRGIEFVKNASAFERLDFLLFDNVFFRRFEKGIYKDNCRVVSIRGNEVMLDECETGLELLDDDASADTLGTEELVFGKMRVGYDPTVSSATAVRLKSTQSQQTEISIDQLNVTGTGTLLELEGGTGVNGIQSLRVRDLLLEMRPPTATTKDAITIAGNVNFIFETIVARAQGAGTERDVFRIADSWVGHGIIGGLQLSGLSGYGVTVGSGVVAATASLIARDIQNLTTPANTYSDPANIGRFDSGPPRRGSATYDPISLADGAGVTTTVTVTGASVGERAAVSFSLDLQGILATAWVSAANTVSVRLQNESGGSLDLASGTLTAFAWPN